MITPEPELTGISCLGSLGPDSGWGIPKNSWKGSRCERERGEKETWLFTCTTAGVTSSAEAIKLIPSGTVKFSPPSMLTKLDFCFSSKVLAFCGLIKKLTPATATNPPTNAATRTPRKNCFLLIVIAFYILMVYYIFLFSIFTPICFQGKIP